MENLTRNAALAALLTLVSSACTSTSPDHDGQEAESESEGDQPCPPEGCETEMPCRDDDNCPDDDPCRDYFCNGRNGFCRYLETDEDGDGYVRKSCDGSDCDDRSDEDCPVDVAESEFCGKQVHPGATEECNGIDDDCDEEIDEEIEQSCGPACGTQRCSKGVWLSCEGGTGPEQEVCDGLDNDCNDRVDDIPGADSEPFWGCNPVTNLYCAKGAPCVVRGAYECPEFHCRCPYEYGSEGSPCEDHYACGIGNHCAAGACRQTCEISQPVCPEKTTCISDGPLYWDDDPKVGGIYGYCGM